ncbi:tripartite tricarboxylate transporter TctB family protein [Rhizobium leucaenae]|uniref:tripartite tricarboxylate transporter TctB family protein n=1 Tax=Rhizobium leucaenae TaxID=29450 RepID=UPI0007EE4ED4|nr:tripartite tricarboxylate transporter TctB family protein [Rhizobium leucaenae]MBB6305205.1 cell division protein FtsW (lipid II flippase) [Rhizobium leucaenae]
MENTEKPIVSRFAAEVAVAAVTCCIGIGVCYESRQIGMGWSDAGPDAGYFPFYIGLLIVFGSVMNMGSAVLKHRCRAEVFIDRQQAKRVASFLLPIVGFAALAPLLGLYVSTAIYVAFMMIVSGGYRWWLSVSTGLGLSIAFFVIFELGFQVPLLKGPVEAWLGIY